MVRIKDDEAEHELQVRLVLVAIVVIEEFEKIIRQYLEHPYELMVGLHEADEQKDGVEQIEPEGLDDEEILLGQILQIDKLVLITHDEDDDEDEDEVTRVETDENELY